MKPHRFHGSVLREYDVRGVVGETLSDQDAYALGRGFATLVRRAGGGRVALGYDGRLSSPMLQEATAKGLIDSGVEVLSIGLGPTPMLYFATYHLKADGGIMITGSHNPPDYNGFKMMLGGKAFFGDQVQSLGRLAASADWEEGRGSETAVDVSDAYVAELAAAYAAPNGLRIAWDCGNGATGATMPDLASRLPGEHVLLNETVDGTFPVHHPDPTVAENLVQLQAVVAERGLDGGIGFDGDGDRIGVIDGQGRILWGDQLLALLARDVLSERPGSTIIADVKASQMLFDEVARAGGQPLMFKTGHSLIKSKMAELGAPLAGEMSGHIFFADKYYGFDDALYVAVRLLDYVARSGQSLAEMRDSLPNLLNTPEVRFDCPDERKFDVVAEVKASLAGTDANVNDIDGVRVLTDDGWWLLRASNTQPVLVVRCESESQAGLQRLKDTVRDVLAPCGITPPPGF